MTTDLAKADRDVVRRLVLALADHPDFRVLRRLRPVPRLPPSGVETFIGAVLDTETTGLESTAKIIELGVTRFSFDAKGNVYDVEGAHTWFEDPGEPLSAEIVRVTGITDEMVAGQKIADDEVEGLLANAAIIIAHNAKFDRPLVEKRLPFTAGKCWACSMEEIDWRAHGSPSSSLEAIVWSQGYFYDAHRAGDDTTATIALLALRSGPIDIGAHVAGDPEATPPTFLGQLLVSARKQTFRVWAVGSDFDVKDKLKAREYRWHDGKRGRPKCWHRDVAGADTANAEIEWLRTEKISGNPDWTSFTCKDRYTERTFQNV